MRYSTTNLTHCHAPAGIAMVARGLCGRLLPGMQENPWGALLLGIFANR